MEEWTCSVDRSHSSCAFVFIEKTEKFVLNSPINNKKESICATNHQNVYHFVLKMTATIFIFKQMQEQEKKNH